MRRLISAAVLTGFVILAAPPVRGEWVYYDVLGVVDQVENGRTGGDTYHNIKKQSTVHGRIGFDTAAQPYPDYPDADPSTFNVYGGAFRAIYKINGRIADFNSGCSPSIYTSRGGISADDACGEFNYGKGTFYASSYISLGGNNVFDGPTIENAARLDEMALTEKNFGFYTYEFNPGYEGGQVTGRFTSIKKVVSLVSARIDAFAGDRIDEWAKSDTGIQLESGDAAPTPEPSSFILLGTSLAALAAYRRRRRR
jgi:hypothetical protein